MSLVEISVTLISPRRRRPRTYPQSQQSPKALLLLQFKTRKTAKTVNKAFACIHIASKEQDSIHRDTINTTLSLDTSLVQPLCLLMVWPLLESFVRGAWESRKFSTRGGYIYTTLSPSYNTPFLPSHNSLHPLFRLPQFSLCCFGRLLTLRSTRFQRHM